VLSSISPFGERARGTRWWETTTTYIIGSTLGGGLLGAVVGGLGGLLPDRLRGSAPTLLLVVLVLVVGLALDLGVRGMRLPTWHRQVEREWLGDYRAWALGLGFGLQLGVGLVTIVTSATTYAVVLLELLSGRWWSGLLVGTAFGLVRALPLLLMRRIDTPEQLHVVFARLHRWTSPADMVARGSLAVAAGAVLFIALGAG
jgi:hypothetical protein